MQLASVASEIKRMRGLEFPYHHSREALSHIEVRCARVQRYLDLLDKSSDAPTIDSACETAVAHVEDALRILGFVLRSTNVRNEFEVHGPMLRLTKLVLGPGARLLLSSEWDFSPFLLLGSKVLPPEFVLIGQPATESSNPFILPLAGHELGHSVWSSRKLQSDVARRAKALIAADIRHRWPEFKSVFGLSCKPSDLEIDLNGNVILSQAVDWCCRQLEEVFCDFFGIHLFGTSFLHAFGYLLSPLRASVRVPLYPGFKERTEAQQMAARHFGYEVPSEYTNLFQEAIAMNLDPASSILLEVADQTRRALTKEMLLKVEEIATSCNLPKSSDKNTQQCINSFRFFVPSTQMSCLADITNGAWNAFLTPHFFIEKNLEERKAEHLSELVLKSIEVLEIEDCQRDLSNAKNRGRTP